jgi:SAM-dependent methyltransferase
MTKHDYLLGDSRRESARLRAQAKLWDPTAHALFDRIGVREGWRVLEIGPGQGSLNLELRRRVNGPVDSVEPSPVFARRLKRGGTIYTTPLADAQLPDGHYDLIFARWVFLFLPDPLAHVKQLARALKPGGILAIEDYYRETFGMVPRPAEWNNFVAADLEFFAAKGGDASIGSRLPAMFERAGLDVIDVTPTIKTGARDSDVWRWLTSYFLSVMDRYATIRPFTPAQAKRLVTHWEEEARLLIAPALLDVVGRK